MASKSESAESLTKISKIEFLIHPGFQSMDFGHGGIGDLATHGHVENPYDALLNMYVEHAKSLKQDELMVAFTNLEAMSLRKVEPMYLNVFQQIKQILGKRFIILGARQRIFTETIGYEKAEGFKTLKKIARARGFTFDKNITTEAFGEMLDGCVEAAANYLNTTGRLRKKTTIVPELTQQPISKTVYEGGLEGYKKRAKKKYKRIKY